MFINLEVFVMSYDYFSGCLLLGLMKISWQPLHHYASRRWSCFLMQRKQYHGFASKLLLYILLHIWRTFFLFFLLNTGSHTQACQKLERCDFFRHYVWLIPIFAWWYYSLSFIHSYHFNWPWLISRSQQCQAVKMKIF